MSIAPAAAGSDIHDQRQMIARMSRLHAKSEAGKLKAEVQALRDLVNRPPTFGDNFDLSNIPLMPKGGLLRPAAWGGLPILRWCDSGIVHAQKAVASMLAHHSKVSAVIEEAWNIEHELIDDKDIRNTKIFLKHSKV